MKKEPEKVEEEKIDNTQQPTVNQEIIELRRELELLKDLFYKDNFSDLQIFRKNVEFKKSIDATFGTIADITTIAKTGGTAPIADGIKTVNIGVGGGSISITTKNGVITAIT